VIDTGGLGVFANDKKKRGIWDEGIKVQVEAATDAADLILFMTDINDGVTPLDQDIADMLRRCPKPKLLVPNKSDTRDKDVLAAEFDSIASGADGVFPISCAHRRGLSKLMEAVLERIPKTSASAKKIDRLRLTVAGRPNVGKSSLLNRLVGNERQIVSDIAGTTRDAVDVDFDIISDNEKIPATLVDTAGLRKKGRADTAVEVFSIMRAESAVTRSDIVLLVLEAGVDGVTAQDKRIGKMIEASGKGCVIVANKWDKCEGVKPKAVVDEIHSTMPFLRYAPVVCASALTGANIKIILKEVSKLKERLNAKVPTPLLNRIIQDAVLRTPPPFSGGKPLRIYYATMAETMPPTFLLFVNDPKKCPKNYALYLKNTLRSHLDLTGLPIELKLRKREKPR
jgi:GTP-binding protein